MFDRRRGRCSCADSEYRDVTCKHQLLFATGETPVPAAISPSDVPDELGGDHLDGEPEFLATDGGVIDTNTDALAARGHSRAAVLHLPQLDETVIVWCSCFPRPHQGVSF